MTEDVRVCRSCGAEKMLTDFCKDSRSKSGYRWFCLTCYRKKTKERYYRQKADNQAREWFYRQKLRKMV